MCLSPCFLLIKDELLAWELGCLCSHQGRNFSAGVVRLAQLPWSYLSKKASRSCQSTDSCFAFGVSAGIYQTLFGLPKGGSDRCPAAGL